MFDISDSLSDNSEIICGTVYDDDGAEYGKLVANKLMQAFAIRKSDGSAQLLDTESVETKIRNEKIQFAAGSHEESDFKETFLQFTGHNIDMLAMSKQEDEEDNASEHNNENIEPKIAISAEDVANDLNRYVGTETKTKIQEKNDSSNSNDNISEDITEYLDLDARGRTFDFVTPIIGIILSLIIIGILFGWFDEAFDAATDTANIEQTNQSTLNDDNDDASIDEFVNMVNETMNKTEETTESNAINLGTPSFQGYLVPSSNGQYVEPVGGHLISFQIIDEDGWLYQVTTCSSSYGIHDGIENERLLNAAESGRVLSGVSFVQADGIAPYANVWVNRPSRYKYAIFAQLMISDSTMQYLKSFVDESTGHSDEYMYIDVDKLGRADEETITWAKSQSGASTDGEDETSSTPKSEG